jgi:hypothetical protein
MSPHLRPCPSCQRHLRTSETACPFCGSQVPAALRAARRPSLPRQRMSRAALVAFSLAGAPACEDGVGSQPEAGPPADAREAGVDTPVYGAPQPDMGGLSDVPPTDSPDAGVDGADGTRSNDAVEAGTDHPVYGAPPPDASADTPVYGAPPPSGSKAD